MPVLRLPLTWPPRHGYASDLGSAAGFTVGVDGAAGREAVEGAGASVGSGVSVGGSVGASVGTGVTTAVGWALLDWACTTIPTMPARPAKNSSPARITKALPRRPLLQTFMMPSTTKPPWKRRMGSIAEAPLHRTRGLIPWSQGVCGRILSISIL